MRRKGADHAPLHKATVNVLSDGVLLSHFIRDHKGFRPLSQAAGTGTTDKEYFPESGAPELPLSYHLESKQNERSKLERYCL
jgi:hypothetical protein